MDTCSELIIDFLPTAIVFTILCYVLLQCRCVTKEIVANAGQFGSDQESKALMVNKALFNFYIVVGLCLTIIADYLKLFGTELFIGLFIALLAGLGVKLGFDLKN